MFLNQIRGFENSSVFYK